MTEQVDIKASIQKICADQKIKPLQALDQASLSTWWLNFEKTDPTNRTPDWLRHIFGEFKLATEEVAKRAEIEVPERFYKYLYKRIMSDPRITRPRPKKPKRSFTKPKRSGRHIKETLQKPKTPAPKRGVTIGDLLAERGQTIGKSGPTPEKDKAICKG